MASAAQSLPILYGDLMPLNSQAHGDWRMRSFDGLAALHGTHAVPLLVEEFVIAQRFYPIVFSVGDNPVPLALMGLNEGVNVFVDEAGLFRDDAYVPAYIRRYPFLLARLRDDADELSLCVDPSADLIGAFEDGDPVFEDGQPSQRTREILGFCEQFEQSSQQTGAFVRDLRDAKLLTEGEFTIQGDAGGQPYVYRGFQMIAEEAVKELRGDVARKLLKSGAMTLVFAHLFSLQRMGDLFAKQREQGSLPPANGPLPM